MHLIDFNAAKPIDKSEEKDTVLIGTHGYASPEQYGFLPSIERSDLYSVGILLAEMITGQINVKIVKFPLGKVISKATDIDPEKRYKSADEFKTALLKLNYNKNTNLLENKSWNLPGFRSSKMKNSVVAVIVYLFMGGYCFCGSSRKNSILCENSGIFCLFLLAICVGSIDI